jgi:methylenetetrahydrofolate reductase (NADPH)
MFVRTTRAARRRRPGRTLVQSRREKEAGSALTAALRTARYEVLPTAGTADAVERHVPRELPVTVTASPRRGIEPTLALVEELARRGYRTVPHLAARSIADETELADVLDRLAAVDVDEAFVIAGDNVRPAGAFSDAYSFLLALQRLRRDGLGRSLERIGVAGYPEGHPMVAPEVLVDALTAKQPMATYVVSQLCFDAETTLGWVRDLRRDGITLPVYVGIAGAVDRRRLLRVASRIGVGQSARFLRRHRHQLARLLLPGGYRPERLLRRLAPGLTDSELGIAGLHVYTLGSLAATERWRRRALDRLGEPGP